MQRPSLYQSIPVLGLLCLLGACGFQLRGTGGTSVPDAWKKMHLVTSNPNGELSRELQNTFSAVGVVWLDEDEANYTVKLIMANPLTDAQVASLNGGVEIVQAQEGNAYLLRLKNSPAALGGVLDEIARTEVSLERLEITPVTLEDVFLELTGNELRD